MSKKSGSKYSIDQLLEKASTCMQEMQPDVALKFLEKALKMAPERTDIMDLAAEAYLETGQAQEAHRLITQSLGIAPDNNPMNWMYLGQMLSGFEALESFKKGIALMKVVIGTTTEEAQYNLLAGQIVTGLVAAAELYLTDLCYEEDAEIQCESLLKEALQIDPQGVEALQSYASMRLSQHRKDEAVEALLKVHQRYAELDSAEYDLPPYHFRVATAKMLIEIEHEREAIDILEQCLLENDGETEVWYLAAHCYKCVKDYEASREYCEKCKVMMEETMLEAQKCGATTEEINSLEEQKALVVELLESMDGLENEIVVEVTDDVEGELDDSVDMS